MNVVCAVCGLKFERAQGYWVGAIYVNYAVTTLIAVGGFFLLRARIDLDTAAQLALWVPFVIVFPAVVLPLQPQPVAGAGVRAEPGAVRRCGAEARWPRSSSGGSRWPRRRVAYEVVTVPDGGVAGRGRAVHRARRPSWSRWP